MLFFQTTFPIQRRLFAYRIAAGTNRRLPLHAYSSASFKPSAEAPAFEIDRLRPFRRSAAQAFEGRLKLE